MTVRRAMSELVAAGILQRVQGRGTFVRSTRVRTESTILGGLQQTLALQGITLATELISLGEEAADAEIAKGLAIPSGTSVWRIVRRRRFDNVPAVREVAIIPRILAPDLDQVFSPKSDSLYQVLARRYGLTETQEEQTLVVRPATPDEVVDLTIDPGSCVVEVTGTSLSSAGTAFDRFEMVFVPHLFAFRLRTTPMADPVDVRVPL